MLASLGGHRGRRELPAGDLAPAQTEMLAHVADDGTADERRGVVPAERRTPEMPARVIAIAAKTRQVDAAHRRNAVVDHDELFVVTVQRPLLRVERDFDAGAAQALLEVANVAA